MYSILFFLSLSLCGSVAFSKEIVTVVEAEERHDGIEHLIRSIMSRQMLEREYIKDLNSEYKRVDLIGFSWDNCGKPTDPIQIKSLSVSPDPIGIPGEETVSFDIALETDITNPTKVVLVIEKKIFGVFIKVPCVDNIGSCTYNEPCNLLKNVTCPPEFKEHNIPCKCPFKKGEVKVEPTLVKVPKLNLPSFVEDGEYQVSATLYNGATRLGCYHIHASLKKK